MKKRYNYFKAVFLSIIPPLWGGVRGGAFLLLFTSFVADTTCLNSVKKVFDEMKTSSDNSKVSYLKYTVTAKLREKNKEDKNIVTTSTFELITNKENSRIYSKEMVVLIDEKNTFTILPAKNLIYWTKTFKDKKKDAYSHLRQMQDTLFKHAQNVACKSVTGKEYNKIVTLTLDKKMSEYMQMKKVTYCIEDQKNILNRVEIEYVPGNQFENITYVFNENNYNYKKEDVTTPVYNLVFESGNALKKQYAGYKLIDTRKK